jgi:UDP-N-acetylglucosamine--N-acetylmuramyl-(pentapeptide) pyrophosphoryl-undecaprenol N-acetylglucosamine transferase
MIPYPFAAGDHQTLNAKAFSEIGAAVLIPDKDLNSFILYSAIDKIINNSEKIETMEKLSSTLSYPNAPDLIYRQIESLLKKVAAQ